MEKLKTLEHALIEQALCQLDHLDTVDTKEFGEVIDMIKDLEDAMYHHTITKAMHKQEEKEEHNKVMYYGDRMSKMTEQHEDLHAHIGQSPMSRKAYIEAKEKHHDKETRMKQLETYGQDLMTDIIDMIKDATPEEKVMLQQKVAALATKIK